MVVKIIHVFAVRVRHLAGFAAGLLCVFLAGGAMAGAEDILPHRAGYELSLKSTRSGSGILDVTGVLSYDWADSCDGWAVEQRYILQVVRGSGPPLQITASYVNWESKDGKRFRYYVKRSRKSKDDGTDEEVQGEATVGNKDEPGAAEFEKPRKETIDLPVGTVFPITHTLAIIEKAEAGEKFDRRLVFEGAELEPPSMTTAFILPQRPAPPAGVSKVLTKPQPVWPINMAVFTQDGKSEIPEFEMTIYLQPNGVVPELTMNYGDFTVQGLLKVFEPLKSGGC